MLKKWFWEIKSNRRLNIVGFLLSKPKGFNSGAGKLVS